MQTRQWLLNGHPRGRPIADDDFKLVETTLPERGDKLLLKTHYLSFDPAQKLCRPDGDRRRDARRRHQRGD
jgi:NADPH-dependent curcumin reductase CurA